MINSGKLVSDAMAESVATSLKKCRETEDKLRAIALELNLVVDDYSFETMVEMADEAERKLGIDSLRAVVFDYFRLTSTAQDTQGNIVYVKNNALSGVGVDRQTFEKPNMITPVVRGNNYWDGIMKNAPAGYVFERTILDDTQPGGLVERRIRYYAPFDRCDRENDYETAWEYFSK